MRNKLIIMLFFLLLILLCGQEKQSFDLYAQGNKEINIDSTFTITYVYGDTNTLRAFEISNFGLYIDYNPNVIEYLSSKKFNKFEVETIGLKKDTNGNLLPGTLILAFALYNKNNEYITLVPGDSLFSLTFHVNKTVGDGQQLNISVYNLEAERCGDNLLTKSFDFVATIKEQLMFILRPIQK